MNTFRIVPAGDAAVVVEFADRIDPVVNGAAIALAQSIEAATLAKARGLNYWTQPFTRHRPVLVTRSSIPT